MDSLYPTFAEASPFHPSSFVRPPRARSRPHRHIPPNEVPRRQKRILFIGWSPPDLRYVLRQEFHLPGGGSVELSVMDSSSPKLPDLPEAGASG